MARHGRPFVASDSDGPSCATISYTRSSDFKSIAWGSEPLHQFDTVIRGNEPARPTWSDVYLQSGFTSDLASVRCRYEPVASTVVYRGILQHLLSSIGPGSIRVDRVLHHSSLWFLRHVSGASFVELLWVRACLFECASRNPQPMKNQ